MNDKIRMGQSKIFVPKELKTRLDSMLMKCNDQIFLAASLLQAVTRATRTAKVYSKLKERMALKANADSPEGVLLGYEVTDFVRGDKYYLSRAIRVQANTRKFFRRRQFLNGRHRNLHGGGDA